MYVILIEDNKSYDFTLYDNKSFYSSSIGIKSGINTANLYKSFESAQPTVKELRRLMPDKYIYAIEKH